MLFLSLLRFFQTFLKVNNVFIGLYENIAFGHFYINGFVDLKAYCTSQLYTVMVIFLYGNPHRKLQRILVTFVYIRIYTQKVDNVEQCQILQRNDVLLIYKPPPTKNDHLPRNVVTMLSMTFSQKGILTPNFKLLCVYVCSIYWQENSVYIAKKIPRIRKSKKSNFHHQTCLMFHYDSHRIRF